MATVNLILDTKRPNKQGEYRIKLRFIHKSVPKDVALQYTCKESQWTGSGVKNYPNLGRVNAYLSKELAKAKHTIDENVYRLNVLTSKQLKQLYLDHDKKSGAIHLTLRDWGDKVIERTHKAGQHGTAGWYSSAINCVHRHTKGNDMLLSEITPTLLNEMEVEHLARGGTLNGFAPYMRGLRSILNKANKEYNADLHPFKDYKIKERKTTKRAIPHEVIQAIRELKIERDKINPASGNSQDALANWHAKNFLLFIFNSRGMNFIDLAKLKKKQIIEAKYKSGQLISGRLFYERSKNLKAFSIKLTDEAIAILNEYKFADLKSNDFIFPIGYENTLSGRKSYEQKRKRINKRFSRLAHLAGYPDIKITSYTIRHTWASRAKHLGISTEVIGESLGHSDVATTEIYLANFDTGVLDDANERIVG